MSKYWRPIKFAELMDEMDWPMVQEAITMAASSFDKDRWNAVSDWLHGSEKDEGKSLVIKRNV